MTTRWEAIAAALTASIRAGEPPVGALLPPEMTLCESFGASRITIRRALSELERRGLVSRRRGAGTRVEAAEARDLYLHDASTIEELLHFTAGMEFRQISREDGPADAATAERLALPPGAPVVALRGLRLAPGGLPVCLSVHHLPAGIAEAAAPLAAFTGSLAVRAEQAAGDRVEEIRQTLEATALSPEDAAPLQAAAGGPALLSRRLYVGRDGRPMLATASLFPAGRYVHAFTIRRAAQGGPPPTERKSLAP